MSRKKEKAKRQRRWQKSSSDTDCLASTAETSKSGRSKGKVATQVKSSGAPRFYATLDRRSVMTIGTALFAISTLCVVPLVWRNWSDDRNVAVAPENHKTALSSPVSKKEDLLLLATDPEAQAHALQRLKSEAIPFSSWQETRERAKQCVDEFLHADVRDRKAIMVFLKALGDEARPFVNPIGLATADPDASIRGLAAELATQLSLDFTDDDFVKYAAPVLNARVMQAKNASISEYSDVDVVAIEPVFRLMGKIAPKSPDTVCTLLTIIEAPCRAELLVFAAEILNKTVPDWHGMQSSSFDLLLDQIVPLTCHDSGRVRAAAFGLLVDGPPDFISGESKCMLRQLNTVMKRLKQSRSTEDRGRRLGRAISVVSDPLDAELLVGVTLRLLNDDERTIIAESLEFPFPGAAREWSVENLGLQDLLADSGTPGIVVTPLQRYGSPSSIDLASISGQIDPSQGLLARRLIELCAADVCRVVDNADFERRYQKWKETQPSSTIDVKGSLYGFESKAPDPSFDLYGRERFQQYERQNADRRLSGYLGMSPEFQSRLSEFRNGNPNLDLGSLLSSQKRNSFSEFPWTPIRRVAAFPPLQADYRVQLKARIKELLSAIKMPVTPADDSKR